jgi:ribonuclease HII
MTIICGVEEAGRGPVIGPMVMAGCNIKKTDIEKLDNVGVKDSKLLTPNKREELFDIIKKIVLDYKIIIVPAKEIDNALNSKDMNLNLLEAKTSADLINELKPNKAILDCPSTNIKSYSDYVKNLLITNTEIIAEHKADLNHTIVGAASILAKVTRDREIEKIKKEININFGSGYPSDPKTVEFLKKYYEKHNKIFRKTWSSYKRIIDAKKQTGLGDF